MQLYILGKNSDDKDTQLEQLTVKILQHQGIEDITTNIQGAGGNEIDITAYSQTTIGICPQKTKVIGECKAQKAPINITDWLKFISKIHYTREIESKVVGIMVCLSGANGAVVGMYNEKHNNDNTIQKTFTEFFLCPQSGQERTLQAYLSNLVKGKVFTRTEYGDGGEVLEVCFISVLRQMIPYFCFI